MAKALVIKGADFSANALDQVTFDVIHAESISISQSTATLDTIGATLQLSYTVVPSTAEDPIRWVSSDTDVATVSNGLVTVTGVGDCTITVSAGAASASCTVSVVVELTDLGRYPRTKIEASNATNHLTNFSCYLNTTTTNNNNLLAMCDSEPAYESLTIPFEFTYLDGVTGIYEIYKTKQELENAGSSYAGMVRIVNSIGFPTPIKLPLNCSKIRCVAPNEHYGAYPLFYQSDTPAYPAGNGTVNKAHYSPDRELSPNLANYSFDYSQSKDFDVPVGYDSLSVTWKTDGATGTVDPADMTETQLAEFKIYAL